MQAVGKVESVLQASQPGGIKRLTGQLLLRVPQGMRSVRAVPLIGGLVGRVANCLVPPGELVWSRIVAGEAQGMWMELNPRTGQSYLRGDTEPAVQKFLVERLRPGMVFYDAGANIGFFSLLAATLVGPGGRVFSFEPDVEAFTRLSRNAAKNELVHLTAVPAGVWSTTGSAAFMSAGKSSPDRGLGRLAREDSDGVSTVACTTLDDFVAAAPPPDVIKIDVEGGECEVLRGAKMICSKSRPVVVCELHSEENRREVLKLLGQFDYTVHNLDDNHIAAVSAVATRSAS